MALEINASKIVNTVTFKIDNAALNEAKNAIKKVKEFSEGVQPTLDLRVYKQRLRQMEIAAKRTADRIRRELGNLGGGRGGGGGGPPPGGNGGNGGGRPPRGGRDRADTAALRRERFDDRVANLSGANRDLINNSRTIAREALAAYERGDISAERLNQTLARQLEILRRSHREQQRSDAERLAAERRLARESARRLERERRERERAERERRRRLSEAGSAALRLSPGGLAGIAGLGALMAGISRVGDALSKTAERNNMIGYGAKNVTTNPNTVLAMTTWGERNGVDSADIKKSIDNIKDVRERIGNTLLHSKQDKNGKWKGGDQGIDDVLNQFGWTPDSIKKYKNNPFDMIGATVNEAQRRGMSDAETSRLIENFGDDLMHYLRMFKDHGEEYIATVDEMNRTGSYLTDQQIAAAHSFVTMQGDLGLISSGWTNKLLDGFMSGINPDTLKEFEAALVSLGPVIQSLGKGIGIVVDGFMYAATGIINFGNKISDALHNLLGRDQAEDPTSPNYNPEMAASVNRARRMLGLSVDDDQPGGHWGTPTSINQYTPTMASDTFSPASLNSSVAYQQGSLMNMTPQIIIPSDLFSIQVTPSATFGDILDAKISDSYNSSYRTLTLEMNSATSANSSN